MEAPRPPVESERRREGWRPDVGVVLADGVEWKLPRPRLRGFVPMDGAAYGGIGISEFGPDYDWRMESGLVAELKGELDVREVSWFARVLLCVNYDLEDGDFYHLLPILPSDPRNGAMWREIWSVALDARAFGDDDPKGRNSSNGSPSASAPTASTREDVRS